MKERMTEKEIKKALDEIASMLDEADADWCVYGSAALVLHGVTGIEAHDVDVMMSANGLRMLLRRLPQVEMLGGDKPGSRFRSLHARVYIKGVEVDLSGDLQIQQGNLWQVVTVEEVCHQDGIRFASLQDCIRLLRLFGRPKDLMRLGLVATACVHGLRDPQTAHLA